MSIKPFVPKQTKLSNIDVYFDQNGNLLDYCSYWSIKDAIKEPNAIFSDALHYEGYYRSRSSACIGFVSKNSGRSYNMSMPDFDDVVKAGLLVDGTVTGQFSFSKKGIRQSVRFHFV